MNSLLVWSNFDICHEIASYCNSLDLLTFEIINSICFKAGQLVFTEFRIRTYFKYLIYRNRTDFNSDKRICSRLHNNQRHQSGGIIVFGGTNEDCLLIKESCQAYDSATIHIEGRKLGNATTSIPFHLSSLTSTSDSAGNILAIGGWNESNSSVNDAVFSLDTHYSYSDMVWENHSRVLPQCCFSAATTTMYGDVILTGGGDSPYRGSAVFRDCFLWRGSGDGIHRGWEGGGVVPSMLQCRCGHAALTLFDSSVVALGGYGGGSDYLRSVELLDPFLSRWIPLPPMAVSRSGPAAVIGPGGAIYVAGGSPDGRVGHKSLERYDCREGKWESLADMHYGRGYTSGCVGASGNFFVIGGSHAATCPPGMECYDFIAQKWRIFGNTPIPQMDADENEMDLDLIGLEINDDDGIGGDGMDGIEAPFADGIPIVSLQRASHQ
eukprot:gene23663-30685_t